VIRGYWWLVNKYGSHDRIFLFGEYFRLIYFTLVDGVFVRSGFSRGAYGARVIAGMIEKVKLTFRFDGVMAYSLFRRLASSNQQTCRILILSGPQSMIFFFTSLLD
jgi:uncharacterized protein (DUF2235 family)